MTRSPALKRFLVSSDYSVYYRKAKQLKFHSAPSSDYQLLTPLLGHLEYSAGDVRGELYSSDVLILDPHTAVSVTGNTVGFLQVTVSSAVLVQHAISMRLIPPKSTIAFPVEPLTNDKTLNRLLLSLHKELLADEPGREIVMRAMVEQLLVQLLRQHSIARRSDELEISRVGLLDRRIRKSIELMHSQMDQNLSLKDLAAASYLSTFHFARLFKKITGVTPHNYLAGIRSQKAQLLLADRSLSINAIAAQVGYLSSSHFTKAFRIATGITPREFRKALID
ncbi:MAG TPA: AraC family transcriptional regulator [Pyrinomonadaceae bacterium]|nr:AraC family transcriptional regulator [Pyrinomonadaceae bacterium]